MVITVQWKDSLRKAKILMRNIFKECTVMDVDVRPAPVCRRRQSVPPPCEAAGAAV